MKSKSRIYLIGLPGTGKSHFGQELKNEISLPFFDLDDLIEQKEGIPISNIFENKGEDYFRKIESELLRSFSEKESFILATGGGSPCFHNGIDLMNNVGVTIYLTQDKKTLIDRLSGKSHRPLMQNDVGNKVDELLKTRSKYYNQADITISHRDVKLLSAQILDFDK